MTTLSLTKPQKEAVAAAAGTSVRSLERYLKNPENVGSDLRSRIGDVVANMDGLIALGGEQDTPPPAVEEDAAANAGIPQGERPDEDPEPEVPVLHEDKGVRSAAALKEHKALKAWEKAVADEDPNAGPRPLTPNYDAVVEAYMTKGTKTTSGSAKATGVRKASTATPEPAAKDGILNVALRTPKTAQVAGEVLGRSYKIEGTWLLLKDGQAQKALDTLIDWDATGPYARRQATLAAVAIAHADPTTDLAERKAPVWAVIETLRAKGLEWKPLATSDAKPAFEVTLKGGQVKTFSTIGEAASTLGVQPKGGVKADAKSSSKAS